MSEWARTLITVIVAAGISLFTTFFTSLYIEPIRLRKVKQEEAKRLRRSLYSQLGIICRTMVSALRSVQTSEIYTPAAVIIRSADLTRFEAALRNVDTFDMVEDAVPLQAIFSTFRDLRSYDLSDSALVAAAAQQLAHIRNAIDVGSVDGSLCREFGVVAALDQCPEFQRV